jgi:hypothetical protein
VAEVEESAAKPGCLTIFFPKRPCNEMVLSKTHSSSAIAVIGFCVKSGWAAGVVLTGRVQSPRVVGQTTIELSDPAFPESRQPYHAGTGTLETDGAKVSRRIEIVRHCANQSVTKMLQNYTDKECNVCSAALAVGSTIDPAKITNPHIRAHALEGQLFRTVLQEALSALGLRYSVVVERHAFAEAAAALALTDVGLKRSLSSLGRGQTGPWRVEQKMAALVAWMSLAEVSAEHIRALPPP